MTARAEGSTSPACPVDLTGVPGCDTGPGGRLAFVARELALVLRRWRAGATTDTTSTDLTRGTR